MDTNTQQRHDLYITILICIGIVFLLVNTFIDIPFHPNPEASTIISTSITDIVAGIVFVCILVGIGYKGLFQWKHLRFKTLIIAVPALVISINNFPFIAHFNNLTILTNPTYFIWLFFIQCLAIGFFEETVFRGFLLPLIAQKLKHYEYGLFYSVILSSAIFGLVHIINLFAGAGFGATVLQIGYSFLMGMMWSVVLLKTKSLWIPILLHAFYNFAGNLFGTVGVVVQRWDTLTIVITTVLALIVAAYYFIQFFKIEPHEMDDLVFGTETTKISR